MRMRKYETTRRGMCAESAKMRRMNPSSRSLAAQVEPDVGNIVFATGGYDHSVKFWHPHDGVCYRTAQHPESVSDLFILMNAHHLWGPLLFTAASEQAGGDPRQETSSSCR